MKRIDRIRLEAFDRSMTYHGGSAAGNLDIVLEDAQKIEEYLLGVPPMRVLDVEETSAHMTDFGPLIVKKEPTTPQEAETLAAAERIRTELIENFKPLPVPEGEPIKVELGGDGQGSNKPGELTWLNN